MQWLYRVIGQAGIFLICAQTVVHFRPKESYDKYLKLLLSVMLLLQLLQPVLSMFGGGDGWNAEEQVTGFMQELQTMWTLHQSGWNDGEVCRRVKENDGRKTGAREEKEVRSNG